MADVTDFTTWSSTAASNQPQGSTAVGTNLDDNFRQIQAEVAKWRDGTGYGILTINTVAGANSITGTTSPAPTLAANQKYLLLPAGTNTGAVFLNINSGGNKNVYAGNSALVGGELHANIPVVLEYDGTQYQLLGPTFKQPTRTVLTSGTGTYTTPTGATRLSIKMVGAGGGGGGDGSTGSPTAGGNGGNTTFGTSLLTANGGSGGAVGNGAGSSNGGAGGTATVTAPASGLGVTGAQGSGGSNVTSVTSMGAPGASTPFGGGAGGGVGASAGVAAPTNSGAGGGGAGGQQSGAYGSGAGGGAGGYIDALITSPSATYGYAVGAAGAAGAAGTNGFAGGAGGSGVIVIDEFYN